MPVGHDDDGGTDEQGFGGGGEVAHEDEGVQEADVVGVGEGGRRDVVVANPDGVVAEAFDGVGHGGAAFGGGGFGVLG